MELLLVSFRSVTSTPRDPWDERVYREVPPRESRVVSRLDSGTELPPVRSRGFDEGFSFPSLQGPPTGKGSGPDRGCEEGRQEDWDPVRGKTTRRTKLPPLPVPL